MITDPNQAADPITSITTWEEVESVPSLPSNHEGESSTVVDAMEEVLILDMKVTFQNQNVNNNEVILPAAAPEIDRCAPLSETTGCMDDLVVEDKSKRSSHDSPRFSTDQTMMSAISELSLHPSDVSMSGMEEMHISPFWKNQEGKMSDLPGDLSSIHATDGADSTLSSSPLLEPFVPPEPKDKLATTKAVPMDVKQEYDMNTFVKIANCLHYDEPVHLPTASNQTPTADQLQQEQQGTVQEELSSSSHKDVVQEFLSSPIFQNEGAAMVSFRKYCFILIKACIILTTLAIGVSPIYHLTRLPSVKGNVNMTTRKAVAHNMSASFCPVEVTPNEDGHAWNRTSSLPLPPAGRTKDGKSHCWRSKASSNWVKKVSLLVSLATLFVMQLRSQSERASVAEMEGGASGETREGVTNPPLPVNSTKHESVIFCHGNRTLTHVKVEVIHHTTSKVRNATWADFDLSQYIKLRVVDLKELLRNRDCKVSGVKMELILRLVESYVSELEAMTVKELRERLRIEGLKVSGRKQELIQRLVEVGMH